MKYMKSIIVIAIIVSAAGIVVWHLMWMTEIDRKVRTGEPSIASAISEAKEKKNRNQSVTAEIPGPPAGDTAVSVQKSPAQTIQAEKGHPEGDKPVDSHAAPVAGLSAEGTTPKSARQGGKWFEKDISLGRKDKPVTPDTGKTVTEGPIDKTTSITIKNNSNPSMQRIIPQPLPVPGPAAGLQAGTPYPTSTEP